MVEILGPYVSYFRVVSAIWEINQLNLYVDVCKYSDVTPFVIVNIFISNCDLITQFFIVTATDYSYRYFVIKLRNAAQFLPNTGHFCHTVQQQWLFLHYCKGHV